MQQYNKDQIGIQTLFLFTRRGRNCKGQEEGAAGSVEIPRLIVLEIADQGGTIAR